MSVVELIQNAYKAADNNEFEIAKDLIQKAEHSGPNLDKDWYDIGLLYGKLGDLKKAIECYTKATKKNPKYFDAWYNMGIYYTELVKDGENKESRDEYYRKAIECYKEAIQINSAHNAWNNMGIIYERLDQSKEALQCYENAIKSYPEYYIAIVNKGYVLIGMNRQKDALVSFEQAIKISPNDVDAWFGRGDAYGGLMQHEKALECYDKVITIDPTNSNAYKEKGRSLEALGENKRATYYFNISRKLSERKKVFKIKAITGFTSDTWTLNDTLDYNVYAKTILRLLSNQKITKDPIAISIQAPWGSGKTSLLRVIQNMVDKNKSNVEQENNLRKVSVRNIINKINYYIDKKGIEGPHISPVSNSVTKQSVTVWFNAWKYETSEQLWAGLVDCIIREIVDRLCPIDRALFLLQINLKIAGLSDLKKYISNRIFRALIQKALPWIVVSITAFVASVLTAISGLLVDNISNQYIGVAGILASVLHGIIRTLNDKKTIENTSANLHLDKYLEIPDYAEKLGFYHNAIEDLNIVLRSIPNELLPLVIFIDDLDRCSPTNVARVFEGINYFLSGDFENCVFIIGMDNQVIASSLEVYYEKTIEKLPEYSTEVDMGWRFVEKFIQLPIVIPPPGTRSFTKYISSLLQPGTKLNKHDTNKSPVTASYHEEVKLKSAKNKQSDIYDSNRLKDRDDIDAISNLAYNFSSNPRAIKRFINLHTYYHYLMIEMEKSGTSSIPTYEQVQRWVVLILRWPAFIQWLYWSKGISSYGMPAELLNSISDKMKFLEELAQQCRDQKEWEEKLIIQLNLQQQVDKTHWIRDKSLREFFLNENNEDEGLRVSDGAGLGIY